ncbi:TonB-dependent siderophore receptor [Thiomicrorhabdus sp. 6S3-12]|uniref:TonB-dependent receptor plug domain-containing protein n=1 Tax=Thiomicrorhabdus sp. 6S3-12 TaxID=2819681 RepID=UPI001AAD3955|nr:TonB-dependent receptor [Thiomicrorhabdus sp. 6S3-12]MBO1924923.1 TonB-dependent receptor [Thiomicrorhabdus sp. 6S3-12]
MPFTRPSLIRLKPLQIALFIGFTGTAQAGTELNTVTVEETNLQSKSQMLEVKDDTVHTESVSSKKIEQKQAANLAQAIADEPGVRVSNECSMCGVKRIMLNGLKGEHTTLMTNGVPNSSIVEGFYGFDAIPMAGVSSIEISRGAGPSLIAPEAIGGVVNVVTSAPREDRLVVDLSQGNQEYRKYQISGSKVSKDGKTALAVSAQSDNLDQYDQDDNWVNESPALENRALNAQLWHQIDTNNRLEFRVEDQQSEIFGGPVVGSPLAGSRNDARTQEATDEPGFTDDSINNTPDSTTTARDFLENIQSEKRSLTAKWYSDRNENLQTRLTGSFVESSMDAIYEPTTYKAEQEIIYLDARGDYFASDEHQLTFGTDMKLDKMRSESTGGTHPADDSYDMQANGIYIRDTWTPSSKLELATALRIDQIDVDFVDQNKTFNETMIAPRAHLRYDHNFNWTSRLSAGKGYRVPLQFFEADHGILDDGFGVDVDKLEKSTNLHYALNYNDAETLFETTISWAKVDNLTYIDADNYTRPTLVNSDQSGQVVHADIIASHQLTPHWSIGASFEMFQYDRAYRDTFGVIPVEERAKLMLDYEGHGWEMNLTVTAIGERDYNDYQNAAYFDHYNQANGVDSKGDHSPAYVTADIRIAKEISKNWQVYAGVNNITDYTQTGEGDSPLFYDGADAGSSDWDVGHIWGPLRGRLVYTGTKLTF